MKKYLLLSTIILLFFSSNLFSIQSFIQESKKEIEITVKFQNKNLDSILVVLHASNTKHTIPNIAVRYEGKEDISLKSSNSIIDNNNFIVYLGKKKEETLSIKGLIPNTDYKLHFYTIKKKSSIKNYQKDKEYLVSTLAKQPKRVSKDIVFNHPPKTNEITLIWSKGDGEKSIVICRENPEKGKIEKKYPENGKKITADTIFGNQNSEIENSKNYIVYEGKGRKDNKATIKGLKPGTAYDFEVIEANGVDDKIHYLIPNNVSNNPRTIFTGFLPPKALNPSEINNDSFIALWEPINMAFGYFLDVSENIDFSTKITGFDNLDVGNNADWMVYGLQSGKAYYFRVKAITKTRVVTEYSNIIKVVIK